MIYIVSFGNSVSGGPETLHQAASLLKEWGYKVGIYYTSPHTLEVPERYRKYNVSVVDKIEDKKENLIIVPETLTNVLYDYHHIKKCIWWLSLNFYLRGRLPYRAHQGIKEHKLPQFLYPFVLTGIAAKVYIKEDFSRKIYHFEDKNTIYHAYNCNYVYDYILNKGVNKKRTIYLCGPLNKTFFRRAQNRDFSVSRKNIILFNPAKGKKFTEKIISYAKKKNINAKFIALQGFTPEQMSEKMQMAKVYIDFGFFPGPERIPREAVTMGCNIITSKNGAAGNDEDVKIPSFLKYDAIDENIPKIVDRLEDMLAKYDKYYPYYNEYREKVANQPKLFVKNLKRLLIMCDYKD